jgi:1-deoxy-D-xylulose-5-phosphate synthase
MSKNLTEYNFPEDLKTMSPDELNLLSYSIRDFLIENISKTGGHLASNLGVVELTIALHRVFDSPEDKIIWDVGHQSYVHKILTGRAGDFDTLRKLDGLSGFPKRKESPHDIYDTGHSSTSISAAAGIAAGRDLKGDKYDVIAVIGDGSMTGGLAFEALNNLGMSKSRVIVILNDNGMSISRNIGGLSEHLGKLRTSEGYLNAKASIKKSIEKIPGIGASLRGSIAKAKDRVKYAIISGGVIFEELGFTYLGPADGHDIDDLIEVLEHAKHVNGPVLVHVITKKGKGYRQAEIYPDRFHGTGPFNTETGHELSPSKVTYSEVFGRKILELADRDDKITAISAAMCDATGLGGFAVKYPKRFFDVGIAEGHGVTFAAGLACAGFKPVVAIYSSFLQRAYDEILEDVCLQKLPVIFALDRAGIVGADGETHHGIFDISYLSTAPGMTILTPASGKQLEEMLEYAASLGSPAAVRYPRGAAAVEPSIKERFTGKNIRISCGRDVDILACGTTYADGRKAVEILRDAGIDAGLVNIGIVKPGEYGFLRDDAGIRNKLYVTLEDNTLNGGFGEIFKAENDGLRVLSLGWPDKFIEHGSTDELKERYGLTPEAVAISVARALDERNC